MMRAGMIPAVMSTLLPAPLEVSSCSPLAELFFFTVPVSVEFGLDCPMVPVLETEGSEGSFPYIFQLFLIGRRSVS